MYIYWLYMLEINRAGTVRMKKAVMKRRRRIWEAGACASSRWAARWTWVWTWPLAPQTTGRQLRRLSAWGSVRRWCWPGRTIDAVRNTCVCLCAPYACMGCTCMHSIRSSHPGGSRRMLKKAGSSWCYICVWYMYRAHTDNACMGIYYIATETLRV